MHTMPVFSPRERPSRMHHRKGKNGSSGTAAVGKSIGRRESGMEAMARYLNKKPLCLQYNVPNSTYARKHYAPGAKRKEQSFIVVILCGIARLMQWAAVGFQQAAVDFLVKPAHELFPDEFPEQCFQSSFYRNPIQMRKRPVKRAIVRRTDVSRMLQSINF
uniref:Response regulatory domain-containing protein n=1 Tax=Caenorhabditis tropicalis TaxID=1561998 RepID=A0A1I7T899_9PELO